MSTPDELDEFAERYYLNPDVADIEIENNAQKASVRHFADDVVGCGRVLHMGWGTGVLAHALNPWMMRGAWVSVVEGSPLLAEEAVESGCFNAVHRSMFEDFPTDDGMRYEYDLVIASHVLEHMEDPAATLSRVHSWLVPGGKVIAIVPNAESLHRRLAVDMGLIDSVGELSERDAQVGHIQSYTIQRLHDDLEAAGFDVRRTFGYQLKPLHNAALAKLDQAYVAALNDVDYVPLRLLANVGAVAVKR